MRSLGEQMQGIVHSRWFGICTIVLLAALSTPSMATHDVDHRYVITGHVRDAQGAPLANTRVEVTLLGGQPAGEGLTDANGRYSIVLHVHNDSIGRRYWVTANGVTHSGEFDFNPGDRTTERGHRIDFAPQ